MATKTRRLADLLANIDDNSKVTSAGLLDATITAADLAANSVGVSELAANVIPVKPHIQPGVLQPAVAGKLLGGSTSHSGAYGTAQADGHKYYYTDIKGSKPIKDPRIGSHFGSQRHMIGSRQLLEQETAQSGENIYSFDGREFFRGQCPTATTNENNAGGVSVNFTESSNFIEITGYFNAVNLVHKSANGTRTWLVHVDGVQAHSALSVAGAADTPLDSRFVRATSLSNIDITSSSSLSSDTTLGIHTLKMKNAAANSQYIYGIELIAQDTSSTANKSKIQIPAQNVVSYGKKFSVSAATPHYDPFNGFTSGNLAAVQALVDTATSLGVEGWNHSSTYYRPYNGGRVVKWVASDGTIKTSVNMMPPNARSRTTAAIAAKANASVANTLYYPTFEAGAIDHSQAEVAKTFHFREFGNGAANGGTGANAWADPSMLSGSDMVAFVMDDGLTSLHGEDATSPAGNFSAASSDMVGYLTFIGTGVSFLHTSNVWNHMAQNLPYCTHIATFNWTNGGKKTLIDGIEVADNFAQSIENKEFSIHQPKMPPIPEDSVVISDYMLMADTVQIPNTTAALNGRISKGMLRKDISRDYLIQPNSGTSVASLSVNPSLDSGFLLQNSTGQVLGIDLPHFGTKFMVSGESAGAGAWSSIYGGTAVSQTQIDNTSVANGMDKFSGPSTAKELGINKLELSVNNGYGSRCVDFNTPIHTSSHYQTFESPFLEELVGGDRNMEQNNLIVTADGKSWDEVTRNTSYLGKVCISTTTDTASTASATLQIFDEWRGAVSGKKYHFNKNFAIAYDRMICLVPGQYLIKAQCRSNTANQEHCRIKINGTVHKTSKPYADLVGSVSTTTTATLNRGDYVQSEGAWFPSVDYSNFEIIRVN